MTPARVGTLLTIALPIVALAGLLAVGRRRWGAAGLWAAGVLALSLGAALFGRPGPDDLCKFNMVLVVAGTVVGGVVATQLAVPAQSAMPWQFGGAFIGASVAYWLTVIFLLLIGCAYI